MKLLFAIVALIALATVPLAQAPLAGKPRAQDMNPTQIINGLLSSDPGVKDRATIELNGMTAETAEKLGTELTRYGVRECQVVLNALANANTMHSCLAALCVLESGQYAVRAGGLDVVTRVTPLVAAQAAQKGLNARRVEALQKLLEDGHYMKAYCEGVDPSASALTGPVEETLRLVIFLDGKLGARGLSLLLRTCADMMLGDREKDDDPATVKEQALRLRRSAALVFEVVWVADPAKEFNYIPAAPYAEREKVVGEIRAKIEHNERAEVRYGETAFIGERYGDYLMGIALNVDRITEARAAAVLRLQWWRGEKVVIVGEGYAEAVDKFSGSGNRPRAMLLRELKKWWIEYRTQSGN
jgi:hypothetical protein